MITKQINGKLHVAMAYAYPERLVTIRENGREVVAREPEHPVRLARETDVSTWWEASHSDAAIKAVIVEPPGEYEAFIAAVVDQIGVEMLVH